MHSTPPLLRLFTGLLLLAACAEPDEFGRCEPLQAITVSSGPVYQFTWQPADCDVHTFSVQSFDAVQWYLSSSDEAANGVHAPLTYGSEPEGTLSSGAEDLVSGRPYTAEMTRIGQDGVEELVGRQNFTIP